jgi:choline-sulfatase
MCRSVPVSGLDILPTLCDYAGIPIPEKARGISLKPALEGKPLERSYIVSEVSSNTGRMVRTKRYKYIKYIDDPVEQLFDMEKDPEEMTNLAGESESSAVIKEHRRMLAAWENQLEVEDDVPYASQWRDLV